MKTMKSTYSADLARILRSELPTTDLFPEPQEVEPTPLVYLAQTPEPILSTRRPEEPGAVLITAIRLTDKNGTPLDLRGLHVTLFG